MTVNTNKYLTKAILLVIGLLSLNIYAQNFLFKVNGNIENPSFDSKIRMLNKEILQVYKNDDKNKFYDNMFRFYILNGDYEKGLYYLNELRGSPIYKDIKYKEIIGIPFELYSLYKLNSERISNKDKYEKTFNLKLSTIPDQTKVYLASFFTSTEDKLKDNILSFLKTNIKNDSISLADAVTLCRYYTSYVIVKETNDIAVPLIKKVDFQQYNVNDSIVIKTKKGNEVSLRVIGYRKGEKQVPTILNFSIYNRGSFSHIEKLNAMKGFTIVYAYSRGIYLSNDKVEPFEFEVEDVNEVISWIIKQPWSDGKVGMIGGSYDGFSQWAAAKNLHPALKTIIPSASVGFGTDFPMYNNCFSPYMLRWLSYVKKETDYKLFNDDKKWLSVYNSYYKNGIAFNKLDSIYGKTNPIFQKWLTHPSFDKFWQSKASSKKDFTKINIPVLTFTGYYDADQRGAMYYYNEHSKYNKNADHYLVIGPYGHSDVISGISGEYQGYKIDPIAKISTEDISYQWFDYILKGGKKPEFLKDKVNYQVMGSNQWKSSPSIDKVSNGKLKLFLNKTKLQESKSKVDYISQKIDFLDRKDTLKGFDNERILDSLILGGNLKDKLIYESDVFNSPFEISGSIAGQLKVLINKKDIDVNINIYEKLSTGQYLKLSHEYFARASYSVDSNKRKLLKPNTIETIPIKNTFFMSRKIEKGSRLVLVLGINKSPDYQINYGTGKDVSSETIKDAKEPLEIKWYNDSYIELPITKN
ncbi:CocE/NonD family hydrolase [Chryseobacterium paludis]|uniref:CocE/NonD family hydrolase n=1 Tax=Chryseobacterium paludis TaxID=2956784 RepID=UPI0021C21B75|nr:CocE/NonD family hydrolase [Chryseobacterium paludis]